MQINGLLIARFVSLAYITWALAGVRFPASCQKESWAWSDTLGNEASGAEAHSWAALVHNTMKLEAAKVSKQVSDIIDQPKSRDSCIAKQESVPIQEQPIQGEQERAPLQEQPMQEIAISFIEDPSLERTSPTVSLFKRQTAIVKTALMKVEGPWWRICNYLPIDEEDDTM